VNALIVDAKEWYTNNNEKARKLYLLTHENNINAHLFYERIGFKHETTLKDHYYRNQDERVYTVFL
jgi:ribosomal protein S18 acetylase RimI-like enzyme